jgi:hypothetical protein
MLKPSRPSKTTTPCTATPLYVLVVKATWLFFMYVVHCIRDRNLSDPANTTLLDINPPPASSFALRVGRGVGGVLQIPGSRTHHIHPLLSAALWEHSPTLVHPSFFLLPLIHKSSFIPLSSTTVQIFIHFSLTNLHLFSILLSSEISFTLIYKYLFIPHPPEPRPFLYPHPQI